MDHLSFVEHHHCLTRLARFSLGKHYSSHCKTLKQSIWRPTSGPRLPRLLRHHHHHHLNRLHPPCPSPPLLHASRHNSASTKPHSEVRLSQHLPISSLTNQKPTDRLLAHITQHNRRFYRTKPQCATDACATRIRSDKHEYETAEHTGAHITARAMRSVQEEGVISQLGGQVGCAGLLCGSCDVTRSR
jgi:hypothetical protein